MDKFRKERRNGVDRSADNCFKCMYGWHGEDSQGDDVGSCKSEEAIRAEVGCPIVCIITLGDPI